jgi:hypothetical protein
MQTSNSACSPRVRNLDDRRLIASAEDASGLEASAVMAAIAMIVKC